MGGKGKGRGGPPPPPPPPASSTGEAAAEALQRRRENLERQKREALDAIAQERELEARKRDLVARLPSLRSHGVHAVPWDSAILSTHLSGGRGTAGLGFMDRGSGGGVDVVELPGGAAVCVRKGASIVTESIADAVAAALEVRVAHMRLVPATEPEAREIQEVSKRWTNPNLAKDLERAEQQLLTLDAETQAMVRSHLFGVPPCAVLEFVPGIALDASVMALETPSPKLLAEVGQLCALDLLLNNMDRVPLPCWTNAGNLTNAIVTPAGRLIGIDQQVNRIEPGPGLDAYLEKVRDLSAQVIQGNAREIGVCVQTAFKRHCGFHLSDDSIERVIEGMSTVLHKAVVEDTAGRLAQALTVAAAKAGEVSFDHPGLAAGTLDAAAAAAKDVSFVQQVVNAVTEIARDSLR